MVIIAGLVLKMAGGILFVSLMIKMKIRGATDCWPKKVMYVLFMLEAVILSPVCLIVDYIIG